MIVHERCKKSTNTLSHQVITSNYIVQLKSIHCIVALRLITINYHVFLRLLLRNSKPK